jgi:uncharacterized FAD-dependent dehydrogenase
VEMQCFFGDVLKLVETRKKERCECTHRSQELRDLEYTNTALLVEQNGTEPAQSYYGSTKGSSSASKGK